MLLAFGVDVCAVHEARTSGRGQIVDAAMTDGAALLSAMFYGMEAAGNGAPLRGENLLDGGRTSTTRTPAPTASTSPWARSSHKFMPRCANCAASTIRCSTSRWIRGAGC